MDGVHSETIEMPALGRPFNLGMLYDSRSDKLVPGITLWDHEKLSEDMKVTSKPNSEFKIVASDSFSDKSSSLGVEAFLKASFFCGLITVDGSAKYLKDTKTSKQQARVTLQYSTTTKFKELTMNQLGRGNIKHPYVFEQGLATHVVTAILYGAQSFFVFDQEVSDTESFQNIQGNLQVQVQKIPSIDIEGEGDLRMNEEDKEIVNKFSCKFHGDFSLSQSPVTFEDAVKVYKDLPTLLGPDGEKAVPVKVWLLPLTLLDSSASKLVRQISVRLVFEVEKTLEFFEDLEMRCQDLLKSLVLVPQIAMKMKSFIQFCSEFKLDFTGLLSKKLPLIRGGREDEAELAEILRKRAFSPFRSDCLNQWVDCKVKEANLIKTFTNMMKNTNILSNEIELNERLCNTKNTICFVFTSLDTKEPYLAALDQYLKCGTSDESGTRATDIDKEQWYSPKKVREEVRQKAKLFSDFAEANKDNKDNVTFLAVGLTNETHEGSTIYLYENGFEESDNFEPPSKPEKLNVDEVTHNSVSLSFSAPNFGSVAVTAYRLEFCEAGGEWKHQTESKAGTVTVTGLSTETEYSFRLRAVTDVGLGPATEVKSIKTAREQEGPRRLAEEVRKDCEVIETKGSLEILKIPLTKDNLDVSGCAQFIYGQDSAKINYTIMLLGATGAGKSTLINGMINYILGVHWTDPYRFKLVVEEQKSQALSQTSEITVYKINYEQGFMINYSLTIIEIPGFGDTRDIKRDQEITEQIQKLFSKNVGISDIHAVCFVVQSALPRLTAKLRHVFDSILSIFGCDVAENIRVLVTFSDCHIPPILEAIKEAGVSCLKTEDDQPAHHKFNNSALFVENQNSADGFDAMFWDMGKLYMKNFFDALEQTEPKSFDLRKKVQQKGNPLENSVHYMHKKVKGSFANFRK